MTSLYRKIVCFVLSLPWLASAADGISEDLYFPDLPEVLTVTRLAQPLAETPGAVTVLDRQTIRRLPVRNVAELLRYVPGYLVEGYNGAQPTAAYHAPIDDYGVRNLVLIDGRPVYSAYNLGDTHRGMLGVLLEDIDRVEVLRGTNSAAYGANALFGVIHIITRHAGDMPGASLSIARGNQGVTDEYLRLAGGDERFGWRLSAGRQEDHGFRNAHDDGRVKQAHLRADMRPEAMQEWIVQLGAIEQEAGEGVVGKDGNPPRTTRWRNAYLNLRHGRELSPQERLDLRVSADEEVYDDAFVYAPDPSVVISSSGKGRRLDIEAQHQWVPTEKLRLVWGLGYKSEEASSPALYGRADAVRVDEMRLFANLEWRPSAAWLINAGGYYGRHGRYDGYFAPRLAANFHLASGHTLRAAVSDSWRMPTLFEQFADLQLYPKKGPPPVNLYTLLAQFGLPYWAYAASGEVQPERLHVEEIGYLGRFFAGRVLFDLRAFRERMRDEIDKKERLIPGYQLPPSTPLPVTDFGNRPGFLLRGIEYQLRWRATAEGELWWNQSFLDLLWRDPDRGAADKQPPSRMTTLAWLQKLPGELDLSIAYHTLSAMSWGEARQALPPRERFDLRLAKPFRLGATRAELAFAVQAANGAQREHWWSERYFFDRRAFATLRLAY